MAGRGESTDLASFFFCAERQTIDIDRPTDRRIDVQTDRERAGGREGRGGGGRERERERGTETHNHKSLIW